MLNILLNSLVVLGITIVITITTVILLSLKDFILDKHNKNKQ